MRRRRSVTDWPTELSVSLDMMAFAVYEDLTIRLTSVVLPLGAIQGITKLVNRITISPRISNKRNHGVTRL